MTTISTVNKNYTNSPKFVEDLADNFYVGIHNICSDNDKLERVGKVAMDYIADYPLYASTSNITYDTAILIAIMAGKPYQELLDEAGLLPNKDYKQYI